MKACDGTEMSPEQRLEAIAALLAEGVLRRRRALGTEPKMAAEKAENQAALGLENSGETRLNVTRPGTGVVPKKASRRGASNTTPALA